MRRGRIPKTVYIVEALAVELWQVPEYCDPDLWWRRVAAEMFGAGAMLRRLGQAEAAQLAYSLASLAGHIGHGELPLPSQSDFATAGGAG